MMSLVYPHIHADLALGEERRGEEKGERGGEGRVGKGGWEDAINNRKLSAVLDAVSEMETMSHECMCVCVCVRERERERGGGERGLKTHTEAAC